MDLSSNCRMNKFFAHNTVSNIDQFPNKYGQFSEVLIEGAVSEKNSLLYVIKETSLRSNF